MKCNAIRFESCCSDAANGVVKKALPQRICEHAAPFFNDKKVHIGVQINIIPIHNEIALGITWWV